MFCGQVWSEYQPVGLLEWQDSENHSKIMQFGREIQNYQKPDSAWVPIENDWITDADTLHTNRRGVLKTDVSDNGKSTVTVRWQGVEYSISQRLTKLIWINTDSWNWIDVVDSVTWSVPSVDSNIVRWQNVFPGVDYAVQKNNGNVAHGIIFKPAFLDSAIILYNQRADSLDIALGNVVAYELSANIDDADSAVGNLSRRILKNFGRYAFKLSHQQLRFPGWDTLSPINVTQRWGKIANKIYCVEYVKMRRIKQIHEAYPSALIWHNSSDTFYGTTEDAFLRNDRLDFEESRNATCADYISPTSLTSLRVGMNLWSSNYEIHRTYNFFDTSDLPDDDVIDSARFHFYRAWDGSTEDFDICWVEVFTGTPVDDCDFLTGDSIGENIGGSWNTSNDVGAQYYSMLLDSLYWLNKTGVTKVGMRDDQDISSESSSNQRLYNYGSQDNVSDKPYIEVWYHTPTVGELSPRRRKISQMGQ